MVCVSIYIVVVSAFFLAFPRVDFLVSGLFYSETAGFWAQNEAFLRDVRHLGPFLVRVIAVSCVAVLVLKLLAPGRPPILPLRQPLFLLTTLIMGPGVLVNTILKDNWGRPRPRYVEEFGGDLPHQPVWVISDHCERNCSFVSGEASAAMWPYFGCVPLTGKLAQGDTLFRAPALRDPLGQQGCVRRTLLFRHADFLGRDAAAHSCRLPSSLPEGSAAGHGPEAG